MSELKLANMGSDPPQSKNASTFLLLLRVCGYHSAETRKLDFSLRR